MLVLLLAVIAVAIYAPHVRSYTFAWDDWSDTANSHFEGAGRLCRTSFSGPRPLERCYHALIPDLLGRHMHWYVAVAVVAAALLPLALFALLRSLRWDAVSAAAVAALAFLFPAADSGRLWATEGFNPLAATLYLVGALALVKSLTGSRSRGDLLPPAAGVAMAGSILLYEVTAPAVALTSLAALWRARRLRAPLAAWSAFALIVVAGFGFLATHHPGENVGGSIPIHAQLDHARVIASDALSLLDEQVLPLGLLPHGLVLAAVGVVLVAAFARAHQTPHPLQRHRLRHWLRWTLLSAVAVVVAYAMYVPSSLYYRPGGEGVANRVNVLASVGWMPLVYALAATAAALALGGAGRQATARRMLPLIACLAIGVVYAVRVSRDIDAWHEAGSQRGAVLSAIQRAVPRAQARAGIFTFGPPAELTPGVPVFSVSWDLDGAVKLLYRDYSVSGWPVYAGVAVRCQPNAVALGPPIGLAGRGRAPYGAAIFVDVSRAEAFRPRSARQCRALVRRLPLGPTVARVHT